MEDSKGPASMEVQFRSLLTELHDEVSGPRPDLADVRLQPRAGEALLAHALILRARCPSLVANITKGTQASASISVDCERDVLLNMLHFVYRDAIPPSIDASSLLRLREMAIEMAMPALDNAAAAALAAQLSPSLCCEVVGVTAREEARARLAHGSVTPACAALRRSCGAYARSHRQALLACAEFAQLPSTQQIWLFAACHEGYALHALATGDASALPGVPTGELLSFLLAPPFSYAIDGMATEDGAGGDFGGATPLQVSMLRHRWEEASLLLDNGASPHPATDSRRRTLLHTAAESGDTHACAFLASHGGVQLNAVDVDGASALDLAVLNEHAAVASALRERGARSTLSRDGGSLAHHLAASGKATALALMLLSTEALELPNGAGLTPLHLATLHGQRAAVTVLIDARADVNSIAPLRHIGGGDSSAGGGPNAALGRGAVGTPLHLACRRGDAALCELLLERGANVGCPAGDHAEMPLHVAAAHPQVSRHLLQAGAGLDDVDGSGYTALQHAAVCAAPLAACRVLLDAGARPNTTDYLFKHTPLHRLCEAGGGAGCGQSEALEVLYLFVNHGAPLNAQDKLGNTPLHLAVFRGHGLLALGLVACGASPGVPNFEGICALSLPPPNGEFSRGAQPATKELRTAMLARIAQTLPWLPDHLSDACQVRGHRLRPSAHSLSVDGRQATAGRQHARRRAPCASGPA